jgi:hypothetical protein
LTNEKSRITPEPRGLAPQEDPAYPTGDEADATTSTAAAAPASTSEATLMIARSAPARANRINQ